MQTHTRTKEVMHKTKAQRIYWLADHRFIAISIYAMKICQFSKNLTLKETMQKKMLWMNFNYQISNKA